MAWSPRMRVSARAAVGLSVVLAAALLHGQAPSQPAAPTGRQSDQAAVSRALRGGAHAVLVDVFPQRDGRVVEGLSADDFEVFEEGKRQIIQSFEFVRIEAALIPQRDPDGLREMYAFAADPRNRLIVIFLDDAHTTLGGSNGVVGPLVDFMNHAVGPGDLIGLATPRMLPQDITFARNRFRIEQDLAARRRHRRVLRAPAGSAGTTATQAHRRRRLVR